MGTIGRILWQLAIFTALFPLRRVKHMYTCRVGIRMDLKNNRRPKQDTAGHYILQIIGSVTLVIPKETGGGNATKTYANPVFSYEGDIYVYNNSNYPQKDNSLLCTASFMFNSLSPITNWFKNNCKYKGTSNGRQILSVIPDNSFSQYSVQYNNCWTR